MCNKPNLDIVYLIKKTSINLFIRYLTERNNYDAMKKGWMDRMTDIPNQICTPFFKEGL